MKKVFKSSNALILKTSIRHMLLCGYFALLITLIAGAIMVHLAKVSFIIFLIPLLATGISIIPIYIYHFFRSNILVEVTERNVRFSKRGKEYLSVDINGNTFNASVVKNRRLGPIFWKTEYFLSVTDSQSRTGRVKCTNFDKSTFNELINALGNPRKAETQAGDKPFSEGLREYTLPKDKMLEEFRHAFLVALVCIIITALNLMGVLPFSIRTTGAAYGGLGSLELIIFIIPVALPVIFLLMPAEIRRKVPEKIKITNHDITVGDKSFSFSEITKIKLTPPVYEKPMGTIYYCERQLTVFCGRRKYIFWLGSSTSGVTGRFILNDERLKSKLLEEKSKYAFERYEEFCADLKNICFNCSIPFEMDL